jgi:hypothetical protein
MILALWVLLLVSVGTFFLFVCLEILVTMLVSSYITGLGNIFSSKISSMPCANMGQAGVPGRTISATG